MADSPSRVPPAAQKEGVAGDAVTRKYVRRAEAGQGPLPHALAAAGSAKRRVARARAAALRGRRVAK
jgi:hypothetical protein